VPVKAALAEMGLIEDVLRQPLLPLAEELRPRLRAALASAGIELAPTLVSA
jgi:dihydrodipicolinate synthase/N-acetylneuraminate lyase